MLRPLIYPIEQATVGMVIKLLLGEALDWASSLVEQGSEVLTNWNILLHHFCRPHCTHMAEAPVWKLQQEQGRPHICHSDL